MISLIRHLHTVKSAANLSDVKLEQEQTVVLIPSIFDIILQNFISFP